MHRKLIFAVLVNILTNSAGFAQTFPPNMGYFYIYPEYINGPSTRIVLGDPAPDDLFKLNVRGLGNDGSLEAAQAVSNPICHENVGYYTGLFPLGANHATETTVCNASDSNTLGFWQRGNEDDPVDGASAFQLHDYSAGLFINTYHFQHTMPPCADGTYGCGGPNASYGVSLTGSSLYQDSVNSGKVFGSPWRYGSNSALVVQANYSVPWIYNNADPISNPDGGTASLSFQIYLIERISWTIIPYVVYLHNSQNYPTQIEGVDSDSYHPFVYTTLSDGMNYATKWSQSTSTTYFNNLPAEALGRVYITWANLVSAISALKAANPELSYLSNVPSDYGITAASVHLEANIGTYGAQQISIGANVHHLYAFEAY